MTPSRHNPLRAPAILCLLLVLGIVLPARADQPLPPDPGVLAGTLENGLAWRIDAASDLAPDAPPGELTVELIVRAGHFHETENAPGAARLLQRMAWEGSRRFPAGNVGLILQQGDCEIVDRPAESTTMTRTRYTIRVRAAEEGAVALALAALSDVAGELALPEHAIRRQHEIMRREQDAADTVGARVNAAIVPRLFPDARFGRRLVSALEPADADIGRDDLLDFYRRWYAPERMTLILAGDARDVDGPALIRDAFGDLPSRRSPPDPDAGLRPPGRSDAFAVSDPELRVAAAHVIIVDRADRGVRTESDLRRDLIERLILERLRVVLTDAADAGRATWESAAQDVAWFPEDFRLTVITATGARAEWNDVLESLVREINLARSRPVTEDELRRMRRKILLDIDREIHDLAAGDSRRAADRLVRCLDENVTPMAPDDRRRLAVELLDDVTAEELNGRIRDRLDLDRADLLVLVPDDAALPDPAAVRAAVGVAQSRADVATDALAPVADELSAPADVGRVIELAADPRAEVLTAWLDNGLAIHHRRMAAPPGRIRVRVTLAGGQIEETIDSRGVSNHASLLWLAPASQAHDVSALRRIMYGRDVEITGEVGEDAVRIDLEGSRDDIEHGLRLVGLLLSEPRLDERAFERLQAAQVARLDMQRHDAGSMMIRTLWESLIPPWDPRPRPLTIDDVRATTRDAAQQWLEHFVNCAPTEIAVVGDIDREPAVELVRRTLGALPARPRISGRTLDDLRFVDRRRGRIDVHVAIDAVSRRSAVLVGFPGADAARADDRRALELAAVAFRERLAGRLRDEARIVAVVRTRHAAALAYPGCGLFIAAAVTGPEHADELAVMMMAELDRFVAAGPTPEELDAARAERRAEAQRDARDADAWTAHLAHIRYRGFTPHDPVVEPDAIAQVSMNDVLRALKRYGDATDRIRITVTPTAASRTPTPRFLPPNPRAPLDGEG